MDGTSRRLGDSDLEVPVVGLGTGGLGDPTFGRKEVERLLHGALDAGVTLIDTAPSYGDAEERIGRALVARRQQAVLSTKVGYGVPGVPDWTPEAVARGIDAALDRLRSGVLDVVHLHSCPREVLDRGGVIEPLVRAVEAGKVRVAAYSGDNEDLDRAIDDGRFGAVQTSLNPWDQNVLDGALGRCRERGLGVLVKRPVAGAPWRFEERPDAGDLTEYWRRFHTMEIERRGLDWSELSVRFAAHQPGVTAILLGTRRLERVHEAVAAVARGPLPDDLEEHVRRAWERSGRAWRGVV